MSRFVFWGLVVLVVLSPLPLAGNRPVPWTALALCVGVLLVLWAIAGSSGRSRGARHADRIMLPMAAAFGLAVGWMALQGFGVFPDSWRPEAMDRAASLLQTRPAPGIGLDPDAGWHVVLRLLCYGGVFLLAWEFGRTRARAEAMLVAVVVAGAGYALYGLVIHAGDLGMVLWYPKTAYGDGLTSTFINRNSYATYAALGLLSALALMFSEWRARRAAGEAMLRPADAAALARSELRLGLLALAVAILAIALMLTRSRGGFYGLGVTLAVAVLVLALAGLLRGRQLVATLGIGALAAAALLLAVGGGLAGRLEHANLTIESSRGAIFEPTVAAIAQRPLTGYGPGSFQGVFEAVNDGRLYRQGYHIDKAHNTYLELALEAGIPAAAVLVVVVTAFATLCLLALLRRKAVRFALAGFAASAMIAIHALVDFSLQMPAVAITYAALLGVGAAQSLRRLAPE